MVDFPASYVRLPECIYCFNDMFWKILVLLSVPIPLHGFTIILCNSMHCTTCRNVCIRFSGCNPRISQPRFVARIPTIHRNHQKKNKEVCKKLSQKSRATQWEDSICFFTFRGCLSQQLSRKTTKIQHRYPKCLYLKGMFLFQAKILGFSNVPNSSKKPSIKNPRTSLPKTAWRSGESRSAPRGTPGAHRSRKSGGPRSLQELSVLP